MAHPALTKAFKFYRQLCFVVNYTFRVINQRTKQPIKQPFNDIHEKYGDW